MRPARLQENFAPYADEIYDREVLEVIFLETAGGRGSDDDAHISRPRAWCDCQQLAKLNGRKIDRRGHLAGTFFVTEIDDDGVCEHCGHFAVQSAKDPTNNEVGLGLED